MFSQTYERRLLLREGKMPGILSERNSTISLVFPFKKAEGNPARTYVYKNKPLLQIAISKADKKNPAISHKKNKKNTNETDLFSCVSFFLLRRLTD